LHLNGSLILVMELIEGESLEKKLLKGKVSRTVGIDYVCQTLSALEYAHARGVVHRDVTPGNLIIDHSGTVKLTDFGVAKSLGDYQLTNAGEIVGSLYYMPPEQVRRHSDPDPRSDIYSVGAVLYEVLTGKKLFACADRLSLMVAQVQQQPIPPLDIEPSIGLGLNEVVIKAIAKDPAQRHQSAREFREVLQAFAKESMGAVRSHPAAKRSYFARMRFGAIAVAAFALAFTGGLGRGSLEAYLPLPAPPAPRSIVGMVLQPPPPIVSSLSSQRVAATHIKHPRPILRPGSAAEATSGRPDEKNPEGPSNAEKTVSDETNATPSENSEIMSEPIAADRQPVSVSHKKRFWSKFNPFRRTN